MKKSVTIDPAHQDSTQRSRTLPLGEWLVDTQAELWELAVRAGLQVLTAMMEADRVAVCGPRYAHDPQRRATRMGTVASEVVLGGRKVCIRRPRVRAGGHEVALPTVTALQRTDPLSRRVVEQMLLGVSTRHYARSLEPLPAGVTGRGTSKSAVSRRFVVSTKATLQRWQSAPLDGLDLVALLLDGVQLGGQCLIAAMGVASDGTKHALGVWDGSTENATVCESLLTHLVSRGLRTDRSLLVILDGSQALRKAVRVVLGDVALVQRCQVHKLRNILDHLPERQRPWARALVHRAYASADVKTGLRLLHDLARQLEHEAPSAAESIREGLEETLTIPSLDLSPRLRRSLTSTNAIESLFSGTRRVKRNVKRWRHRQMMLRWVAAGIRDTAARFHRLFGHADLKTLVTALRRRDQQLGLAATSRQVA
jgi:transposase-like protein